MDAKTPKAAEKKHAIVKRERVSKEGAALSVYTLQLSDEWKQRLTIRRESGLRRVLKQLAPF